MAWIVRLVSTVPRREEHSTDVLRIARPGDLTDLASLGLTLADGKRLLAASSRSSSPLRPAPMPSADRSAGVATPPAG